MPTSIIITHLPPPPPLVHPRCLSKVLSPQHSPGSTVCAMQQGSRGYRENFISIKQLHGNRSRAQGPQQPSYPLVFHYFWEHLNEEDIQSATWPETTQQTSEKRETVNISQSIDWLSDNPISSPEVELPSSSVRRVAAQQSSKFPQKCQRLSDWVLIRWSYNRLTSIIINGQKKDKSIP